MHEDEQEEHEDEHEDEADAEHDHGEDDESFRDHDAHEHGAAALLIAWSGNELAIDLETPAFNVLGFEYAPASDAEHALLDESVAALEEGNLLQLTPEAECTITSAVVHAELDEDADGHEGEHEDEHEEEGEHDEEEETHSDIDVSYNVQCQFPEKIESLDATALFAQFPNFAELRAEWVSDTQQSAKELTADDPILSLK